MSTAPLPSTMTALVIDRTGSADELHLAEVPRAIRISDELLIRVIAAGVNPIDAKTRVGRGASAAISTYPAILGNDFAGVVEETPFSDHPLQPGDRVYGMARPPRIAGSYAGFVAVSSLSVCRMPRTLDFVHAAGVPLAALTAWGAIETARVQTGQSVLIHAGAGGVGHFAIQFARRLGAIVTTTGSARNTDFLRALGAHRVIDYATERFEDVADQQDAVIDLIGNVVADTGMRSLELLRQGGILVNLPTGSWPTMADDAAKRGIHATGFLVSADARTLSLITQLIDEGAVRVHIDREFPLAEGAHAHRLVEAGHVRGKIVLRVAADPLAP